jgi:hypothetical protein
VYFTFDLFKYSWLFDHDWSKQIPLSLIQVVDWLFIELELSTAETSTITCDGGTGKHIMQWCDWCFMTRFGGNQLHFE